MEGAVRSCTRKCAAILACGAFWGKMVSDGYSQSGLMLNSFAVEYGKPIRGKW